MKLNNVKGFTLVELLVVMAIIATIAVISVPPLMEHLKESRDTVRNTQIKQIEQAITVYSINNGEFPVSSDFATLKTDLKPYLPKFPIDPRDGRSCLNNEKCEYTYKSDGSNYHITAGIESEVSLERLNKVDGIDNNVFDVYNGDSPSVSGSAQIVNITNETN